MWSQSIWIHESYNNQKLVFHFQELLQFISGEMTTRIFIPRFFFEGVGTVLGWTFYRFFFNEHRLVYRKKRETPNTVVDPMPDIGNVAKSLMENYERIVEGLES